MKLEMNHFIIGIVILAVALGVFYTTEDTSEDNLSVTVDGMGVEEDTYALQVFGSLRDEDYVSSKNAYVVLPGQTITIESAVYNPTSSFSGAWYKTSVYTEQNHIVSSVAVYLEPGEIKEATINYRTPTNIGRYSICVESAVKTNEYDIWWFDDLDCFDIEVVSPNPCIGITCDDYCSGTTLYNYGVCVNGICEYDIRIKAPSCGYVEPAPTATSTPAPTATPTPAPTATPTITPTPTSTVTATPTATATVPPVDDDDTTTGILWWGAGIISVLLILLLALRSKK